MPDLSLNHGRSMKRRAEEAGGFLPSYDLIGMGKAARKEVLVVGKEDGRQSLEELQEEEILPSTVSMLSLRVGIAPCFIFPLWRCD